MGLPDVYVLLSTSLDQLKERSFERGRLSGRDDERILRKYEHYLRLIEPQRRYFAAMAERFPGVVTFAESRTVQTNAQAILLISRPLSRATDLEIFDHMIAWLSQNKPDV